VALPDMAGKVEHRQHLPVYAASSAVPALAYGWVSVGEKAAVIASAARSSMEPRCCRSRQTFAV